MPHMPSARLCTSLRTRLREGAAEIGAERSGESSRSSGGALLFRPRRSRHVLGLFFLGHALHTVGKLSPRRSFCVPARLCPHNRDSVGDGRCRAAVGDGRYEWRLGKPQRQRHSSGPGRYNDAIGALILAEPSAGESGPGRGRARRVLLLAVVYILLVLRGGVVGKGGAPCLVTRRCGCE